MKNMAIMINVHIVRVMKLCLFLAYSASGDSCLLFEHTGQPGSVIGKADWKTYRFFENALRYWTTLFRGTSIARAIATTLTAFPSAIAIAVAIDASGPVLETHFLSSFSHEVEKLTAPVR